MSTKYSGRRGREVAKFIGLLTIQGSKAITSPQMVDRINDIAWQAHQGSVAAIIQILNERLANYGVRTRAIFANGVLQILCEATTLDQLEQSILVKQIQQTLESIGPRNVRRVNINSRIVREQQLLWLEEITREPEKQLLWSQEIALVKPNVFQQLITDIRERKTEPGKSNLPKSSSSTFSVFKNTNKIRISSLQSILQVSTLCVFLLLLCGTIYALLGGKLKNPIQLEKPESVAPSQSASSLLEDPFAAAVRVANYASASGKTAKTSAQWLDLAARWQRASELMNAVPPNHSRYQEAQIRTRLYRKYSEAAEQEAKKTPSPFKHSSLASFELVAEQLGEYPLTY